jgi:ABC-type multidrug transport system ATPase subunit
MAVPSPALHVGGLTKVFTGPRPLREVVRRPFARRRVTALDDVTFRAAAGEVVGLIGPNGAGKTTLIKILAGLVLPDAGEARILGAPAGSTEARRQVGLVTAEERSFFWRISTRENLRFFAALHGLARRDADRRIAVLAERLELGEVLDRPVRELSSGNRGRLALARGMLHGPRILLLDEVARALDPGAARRLRRLLRALADEAGLAILYAIHDLPEVRRLCDRVVLLRDGAVAAEGAYDAVVATVRETFDLDDEDLPGEAVEAAS